MILVIIRMKVISEKRLELSQTIASLTGSIRTEKGCERCDFCQNIEDENELYLLEEWDTQENLIGHQQSERFRILRGAMNEAHPRTDREKSFRQEGHPGHPGSGGEKRDQGDHPVAISLLPLQVELYWSSLEPKTSPGNSHLKKKGM